MNRYEEDDRNAIGVDVPVHPAVLRRRMGRWEQVVAEPTPLQQMMEEVLVNNVAHGWAGPDAPERTFGDHMALLITEVGEAVDAFRKWGLDDATAQRDPEQHLACGCGPAKPEGVGSEFADIFIRLLDSCAAFGVDLDAEYRRKMAYNVGRPFRHGGRRL